MTPDADPTERLAGLREVRRATDWHDATALWSVQNDIDWLLEHVEQQAVELAHLRALLDADDVAQPPTDEGSE
ncbi:MAG: hypothetical protein L0227_11195 [Chloroflexi bacterium]|nr:hypothetical protein [Chloroflexota bacterium]